MTVDWKNIHRITRWRGHEKEGWAVLKGDRKPLKICPTQKEALRFVKSLKKWLEIAVHNKSGMIRKRITKFNAV